jgi:hypothetical protein
MIKSVFTEKYSSIQRKLINSAIVEYNGDAIPVISQWDTGATGTCISKELVQKLGLLPTGMVKVHTPSGVGTMNKYMINLILNNEVRILNLPVMDSEIGKQGIDVLIGMDIISLGDFAISNYDKKTQFSFRIPSQEHVEYHR